MQLSKINVSSANIYHAELQNVAKCHMFFAKCRVLHLFASSQTRTAAETNLR
jgi:hypothetical protein